MTTIHRFSPDDIAKVTGDLSVESPPAMNLSISFNTTTSGSSGPSFSDYGASSLSAEIKQIQRTLNELKAQRNLARLSQAVNNLDTRIGRLEKQSEMVLNTLLTLVQIQTGNMGKTKVSVLGDAKM